MDDVELETSGTQETENASQSNAITSFGNIALFLSSHKYPDGSNLNQKRTLRKAAVNFCIDDGRLYYIGKNKSEKRLVIQDEEKKRQIFLECHTQNANSHCGQKKTLEKIESLFFWRGVVKDVVSWIQLCEFCKGKEDRRQPSTKKLRQGNSNSEMCPSPFGPEVPDSNLISGSQQSLINRFTSQTGSLHHQIELIEHYEQEILSMAEKAENNIDEVLDHLLAKIIKCITRRKRELKAKVSRFKEEALAKVKQPRAKIETQLGFSADASIETSNSAQDLTSESRMNVNPLRPSQPSRLLHRLYGDESVVLNEALLSLAEVPRLENLGGVWTTFDVKRTIGHFEAAINSCGIVHGNPPCSVSHVVQVPAGLRIFGCNIAESGDRYPPMEVGTEHKKMRLSYRQHLPESSNQPIDESSALDFQIFHHETQPVCYVSRIEPNQLYELYISYQDEGSTEWSPWSYAYLASTALPSMSWDPSSNDWHVSPDMREATKRINSVTPLFLSAPQFFPGCKIGVKILKRDATKYPEEGLALVQPWVQFSSLCQEGTLFLNLTGQLFLDGNFIHSFRSQDSNRIMLTFESSSQVHPSTQGMRMGCSISYGTEKFLVEWNLRGQEGSSYVGIQLNNQGSCARIET